MSVARSVEAGFFPLDKELDVPAGQLLPHAHEALVRLSSELPFAKAAQHLAALLGVRVAAGTARRQTLSVGRRLLDLQTQQAEPLARCREEPTVERLVMSTDGAFVPLIGGQWGEVKLMAIGRVTRMGPQARTTQLSYFARLADAATFADQASVEIRRRGIERAKEVGALQDGAEWVQGFVQAHRADALRILDFAHAAEYLAEIAQLIRAAGGHLPSKWLEGVLHRLKQEGPERLLRHLTRLAARYPQVQEPVRYLQKRRAQMDYPTYQQQGWPIGSGSVECGNKLVMQARLKRPGMHWKPENVNPMLTLRMALCNDRWQENWDDQRSLLRLLRQNCRRLRQQQRFRAQQTPLPPPAPRSPASPRVKTGRTEAQKQWGRRTFSLRLLQQATGAKL